MTSAADGTRESTTTIYSLGETFDVAELHALRERKARRAEQLMILRFVVCAVAIVTGAMSCIALWLDSREPVRGQIHSLATYPKAHAITEQAQVPQMQMFYITRETRVREAQEQARRFLDSDPLAVTSCVSIEGTRDRDGVNDVVCVTRDNPGAVEVR